MKSFKFDTHVHTVETSRCGRIKGEELVRLYKDAGYQGIAITDHYYDEYFENLTEKSWEDKLERFLTGYREAFRAGQHMGIDVVLGAEIRFNDSSNDYLVYGLNEDFLVENRELYQLSLGKFRSLIENENIMIFQAHPFRIGMTPSDPALLDGIEVFNGNPRHDSRNHLAFTFAEENSLRMISGSDFHQIEDLARGGIVIPDTVSTSEELVQLFKSSGVYGLITD